MLMSRFWSRIDNGSWESGDIGEAEEAEEAGDVGEEKLVFSSH